MIRRSLISLLIFSTALPVAAEPVATSMIQLRKAGPLITPEDARALTPATLGETLLLPGHPPVIEATIGPEGMEPPTPPGRPTVTRIKLYLEAARGEQRGFCQRVVAAIFLKPVSQSPTGTLPASGPDTISTQIAYRWVGTGPNAPACEAPKDSFFIPRPGEEQQAMTTVRLLASAQQDAKQRHSLPFALSVEDKEGSEMAAFYRENHKQPPKRGMKIITDARKALASLPIDAVTFAGPAMTASPDILFPSDLTDHQGRHLEAMTVFLGGDWTAGLVLDGGHIVRLRLLRQIPPPF